MSDVTLKWLCLAIGLVVGFVGDYYTKSWATHKSHHFALIGVAVYTIGSISWLGVIKSTPLAKAGVLWTMGQLLASVVMGSLLFNEHLSVINKIGVGLAFAAIWMITRE